MNLKKVDLNKQNPFSAAKFQSKIQFYVDSFESLLFKKKLFKLKKYSDFFSIITSQYLVHIQDKHIYIYHIRDRCYKEIYS